MRLRASKFGMLLLLGSLVTSAAVVHHDSPSVSWVPRQLEPGSPCLFRVSVAGPALNLSGQWQGHEITFFPDSHHDWYGLAGVDLDAKPGNYMLKLEATLPDGKRVRLERTVAVQRAHFKTETLRVPDRFVEPGPDELRQIDADKQLKKAAFSHELPNPQWSGKFTSPIDTSISEAFGTRRVFNGKLASIHRGLDYHAKFGSPVIAANSGEVVLAGPLFYEGNCVIIDHGQQFMTVYMHLSQVQVRVGERVERGQQIGLTGASGRVTGPHLHMAVRWQGEYLDPAQLWALPLPNLPLGSESIAKREAGTAKTTPSR